MRARNNRKNTILAGVITVGIGIFYLSTVGTRPETLIASSAPRFHDADVRG